MRFNVTYSEAVAILALLDPLVDDESTLLSVAYDEEMIYTEARPMARLMHLTVFVSHLTDKMRIGTWSTSADNITIEARFTWPSSESLYAPHTNSRRTSWRAFKDELEDVIARGKEKDPMDLRIELIESPDRTTVYINDALVFDGDYFGWQDLAHLFGISYTRRLQSVQSYLRGDSLGQEDFTEALCATETDEPQIVTEREGPAGSVIWRL